MTFCCTKHNTFIIFQFKKLRIILATNAILKMWVKKASICIVPAVMKLRKLLVFIGISYKFRDRFFSTFSSKFIFSINVFNGYSNVIIFDFEQDFFLHCSG